MMMVLLYACLLYAGVSHLLGATCTPVSCSKSMEMDRVKD